MSVRTLESLSNVQHATRRLYVCAKCGGRIVARGGLLKCCGITEREVDAEDANREAEARGRIMSRDIRAALFPDVVIGHWNEEDNDYTDFEGIPNT